jgi:O-antigen ligase
MALYRFNTVLFLFLAFAVPLRYHVDRPLFLQCLKICWFFTCVLAISEILDFFDIVDMAFTIERLEGYVHMGVWGFIRAGFGKMLVIGAFMSFTMTQLTKSHLLKILGYSSFPLVAVGLLCSYSRSSMVSFALSVMALIVMLGGVRAFKGLVIAVISFAAIYIIMAQLPEVQERFMTFLTLSRPGDVKLTYRDVSAGRIEGWLIMINWLLTRPDVILIGTGFQNFNYFVNLTAGAGTLESGHNSFLQVLIEVGVIGLVVFICWIVSIFSWLLRWRRSMTNPLDRMVPGIFFSLMLGLVASCAVSETLVPAAGVVILQVNIYILLGIWISYYRSQMLELNVPAEGEYADYEMNEETAQLPQEDPTYEY